MRKPVTRDLREEVRQHLLFLRESGIGELKLDHYPRPAIPGPVNLAEPLQVDGAVGQRLEALKNEIGDCTRCRLCEGRSHLVFGVGNPEARLMFVGEGPGAEEDRQGIPFVGRAGQLLNRIIGSIGLKREEVYIANVVKCRPPKNRTPMPDEVATCLPFLRRQIETIQPRVICALGAPAAQNLLQTSEAISRLRGGFRGLPDGTQVMPTFHPAYLLRNPEKKREVWEDMKKIREFLAQDGPT